MSIGLSTCIGCPAVEQPDRFTMEPISRPVGRDIGAVAPNTADLLPTERLPDVLTILDILAGKQDNSVGGHNSFGYRRSLAINFSTKIPQHGKRGDNH